MSNFQKGWIGVDLDGTLAVYTKWVGPTHIGAPVPKMLERVKQWVKDGHLVKIFTARAADPSTVPHIQAWLVKNGLPALEVTNKKDLATMEIWDDRAVQIIRNTGERADGISEN